MDFLDSLDLKANEKKSDRMRSWYLYEQYKSLERHQLDAAEQLKNRCYQERLLHRELTERRARRRLYQRCGLSHSEPRIDCSLNGHEPQSPLSTTTDDFYESFCELNDDFQTIDQESVGSDDVDQAYMEDFKDLDGLQDDTSNAESVTSVVEKSSDICNAVYSNSLVAEKLESVQRNIAKNINLQLETVKENMLCLEKYARMSNQDRTSEEGSVKSAGRLSTKVEASDKENALYDSNVFTIWSRLVSFAYQVIQLNHGNCYYDYSSQLMTAVLACDVLRRGVNRMCDILQPYVSPIKFAETSDDGSNNSYKNVKRKRSLIPKNYRKSSRFKINSSVHKKGATRRSVGNYHSDNLWRDCSKYSLERNEMRMWRGSEPYRAYGRALLATDSTSSYWPRELARREGSCRCLCHKRVVNPMLELVRHLDNMLKSDFDDFVHR